MGCLRHYGRAVGVGLLALMAAGCPANNQKCMTVGGSNMIVADAALLKMEVWGAGVACVGNGVAASAGAPSQTMSFMKGQTVKLDIPPGQHTIVLLAYSDANGAVEIGSGCQQGDFSAGAQICINLSLTPVDAGMMDLSIPHDMALCNSDGPCPCAEDSDCRNPTLSRCGPEKKCVQCLPASDNCGYAEYCTDAMVCAPGCKKDTDCVTQAPPDMGPPPDDGGVMSAPASLCNVSKHICVQCLMQSDCPVGQLCSPSGACVDGCDLTQNKNCKMGFTCCNNLCIDARSDPLNCSMCGMTCNGGQTLCCNAACANPLTDVGNCGKCGTVCGALNSTPSCANGNCSWNCNMGFAHCTMDTGGCETPINTLQNCGGCNNVCDVTNANSATCNGMKCSYTCKAGFADCQMVGADIDGCETDITTVMNCGGCGNVCNLNNATGATCSNGKCAYTCKPGFADCNMMGANTDGCETDLTTPANCGGCGKACDTVNSNGATCNGMGCSYASCKPGHADCNMMAPDYDGCETPTNTTSNCGGCGNVCNVANANSASCNGTSCSYVCKANFADCVMVGANTDGCETSTAQVNNCTGCGKTCDAQQSVGAMCNGTTCSYSSCKPGFADCSLTAPDLDGCETNTNSSVTNCGGCGKACDMVNSNGAMCSAGACTYQSCKNGFADCVMTAPNLNGCETATTTTSNCGGCGNVCNVGNANSASCNGTTCSYVCKPGFADCSMLGANTDGCETPTTTTTNCGGCGNQCMNVNASASSCNGTKCGYTCNAGFGDCVQTGANTDGCETNTNTTVAHCGSCGTSCDTVNSNGAMCAGGACTYTGCKAGFADCSMNAPDFDGCETPTNTINNCSGCGIVCNAVNATVAACNGFTCSYTCKPGFYDCVQNGVNTDGCETQEHINGIGNNYVDCADPLGTPGNAATYNGTMATDARAAWPVAGTDVACSCINGTENCVMRYTNTQCTVWVYSGVDSGRVLKTVQNGFNGNNCFCGTAAGGDPTWN
jgi:hypothetical protein